MSDPWESLSQDELLAAWKEWRDVFQTAHDRVYCDWCREQHAFCDCGTRMAYTYLERQHYPVSRKDNHNNV